MLAGRAASLRLREYFGAEEVLIIAQMIRASLLASATVTRRPAFSPEALIQSASARSDRALRL
jgi:hypothetical protein